VQGALSYSTLKGLPYTEHFIYEVLRLYPPVPSDPKQVMQDDVLPGGVQVYAGETSKIVLMHSHVCADNTGSYLEPKRAGTAGKVLSQCAQGGSGPLAGVSTRMYCSRVELTGRRRAEHNGGVDPHVWSHGFIPFQNGGRRTCLGQEMALLEAKAFICSVVRAGLRFETAPGQKICRYPNITISAKNGIVLIPRRRV
jgi:cytochrome P450